MTQDLNTLICLFHHQSYAQIALEEILDSGVPESNVTLIGAPGSSIESTRSTLSELNVPDKDLKHLLDGVHAGGAVLSVSAISSDAEKVEAIFAKHRAGKIAEADVADDRSAQALPGAAALDAARLHTGAPLAAASSVAPLEEAPKAAPLATGSDEGELIIVEQDIMLVRDEEFSTEDVQAFDVVSVVTETIIPGDGAPAEQSTESRFDPSAQPVLFSPQVY
jgi:hypothetical protein